MPVPGANEEMEVTSCRGARRGERRFRVRRLIQPPLDEDIVQTHLSLHSGCPMHPGTVGRPPRRTPVYARRAFHRNALQQQAHSHAFTLLELLVVIAIIAILVGLLFPAFKAVQNQAKQTQAKNDLTQIVNAVNAFYTEYGKYPITTSGADVIYGPGGTENNALFKELQGCPTSGTLPPTCSGFSTLNTRQIVFISPPAVKTPANPRSGIATQAVAADCPTGGRAFAVAIGDYVDPWGTPYNVEIDGNYDNQITTNPYGNNNGAGPQPLTIGVIAWSLGLDGVLGTGRCTGNGIFTNSDDVISWQ
jgi:prepilin-type N-terminal cleavage/methylation domain-containing protein